MAPKDSSCRSRAWGEVSAGQSAATVPGRACDEGSGPDADGGVHTGCHPGGGCSWHPTSRRQACSPTAWGAQGTHPAATRLGGGLPRLRSCTQGLRGRPQSSNAQGPGRRTHSGGVAQRPPGPSGGLYCTSGGAHSGESDGSSTTDHLTGFSLLHFPRAWAMRAAPPTTLGGRRPSPRRAAAWTRGVQAERSQH